MSVGWIDLDGVVNMRDVGGLPTTDGGRIRRGRLIRSDNLQDLTASDVTTLTQTLGVTDVVDLRTHTEVNVTGPGPLQDTGIRHHHFSLLKGDLGPRESGVFIQSDPARRSEADYWSQHYLGYLDGRPESVTAALDVIATAPGATIVHCAAGKDRTGTVTALALLVAGVDRADVIADYVASAERIALVMQRLAQRPPYDATLVGHTIEQQTPRAESMAGILDALDDRFGGVTGWLSANGWSTDRISLLAQSLRE